MEKSWVGQYIQSLKATVIASVTALFVKQIRIQQPLLLQSIELTLTKVNTA
jgi:hypothetical protein